MLWMYTFQHENISVIHSYGVMNANPTATRLSLIVQSYE